MPPNAPLPCSGAGKSATPQKHEQAQLSPVCGPVPVAIGFPGATGLGGAGGGRAAPPAGGEPAGGGAAGAAAVPF